VLPHRLAQLTPAQLQKLLTPPSPADQARSLPGAGAFCRLEKARSMPGAGAFCRVAAFPVPGNTNMCRVDPTPR
jgi:hypothetical protein